MSLLQVKQLEPCANGCRMSGHGRGEVRFGDYELWLAGHLSVTLCVDCAREAERVWKTYGGTVYKNGRLRNRWGGGTIG